ncbi:DNA-binding response regulator [Actinoplanes sp. NBRC 14428]|uniref:Two-component system copper resistance phosphate regulon response regulator CusR n=1 Tax=Pseudosporangium ferrugineum TaxID=439699 RepID=A0A2T0RHG2_9ACTN|nr:response regulator transcription factor [Pseudosporangium ferrugineum]PRY20577.1 two-component system copper resistance phosphate regulon response regulator CusR [Pseudosporangium ferrugineum]BCJ51390.1 DNA-binding response regulator [Actinoplanes sp. NBRC 14428]
MRVLVVEDDRELGPAITAGLRTVGFAVDYAWCRADADLKVSVNSYDCVVADRGLPDGDVLGLIKVWRGAGRSVPVLVLTALGAVDDRVSGFEHGADDYLVKPFAMAELVARVRALCRRGQPPRLPVLTAGDLTLDVPTHRVRRAGVLLTVTAKEFAVLEALMVRAGEAVTRTELLESCWDEMSDPASNVVDAVIVNLRRKLGPPDLIESLRGVGYRLRGPA